MKVIRIPTNIIVKEIIPHRNVIHLFGKYYYDKDFKIILKGDKHFSELNR